MSLMPRSSAPTPASRPFTIQGPHGRQFTVNVSGQTEWDGGAAFSDLTSSSIVQVSGSLDRADATIDADEIAILSDSGFYASGQVTYVNPPSAAGDELRSLCPRPLAHNHRPHTTATRHHRSQRQRKILDLLDARAVRAIPLQPRADCLPGQHIAVGGPASGATSASGVTVKRVVLRHWGFNGTVVPGSVNSGNTLPDAGQRIRRHCCSANVTVYIPDNCQFATDSHNCLTSPRQPMCGLLDCC